MTPVEYAFLALTAFALFGLVVSSAFTTSAHAGDRPVRFDADVPDVDSFDPTDEPGVATVDGDRYGSLQAAVDAAEPGDTITLEGRFEERVTVDTPGITITSDDALADEGMAVVDGGFASDDEDATATEGGSEGPDAPVDVPEAAEEDGHLAAGAESNGGTGGDDLDEHVEASSGGASDETVLAIDADDVTIDRVWIRNSGYSATAQDAGIFVNGSDVAIVDARITDVTFGIWVESAEGGTVRDSVIVGHDDVDVKAQRGNGIHLYQAMGTVVADNTITEVRDGIYFSFASGVHATGNTMWDLRFGVHYMYSDDCLLAENVAFDNDVGYALMVSRNLEVLDNVAVSNQGPGGQGILVLQIDDARIEGNEVVGNVNGFHLDNAQRVVLDGNLVLENDVGVSVTAGSTFESVTGNSFVDNELQVATPMRAQQGWHGNYWSDASVADLTGDGTSEVRHQPEGLVETLVYENPEVTAFADSPAFDAIRIAESSFPVIEAPGVVDERPLVNAEHEWGDYYAD